jgi:hypothetical protein
MNIARENHTATLLGNGKVLVAGGSVPGGTTNAAELYDPIQGTWTLTDPLPVSVFGHMATLLPSGKVLVTGGVSVTGMTARAEVFDPAMVPNGRWTSVGAMGVARRLHSATLLQNGKVLVAAGQGNGQQQLTSTELFDPTTGRWQSALPLLTPRVAHLAALLPNGKALVAGGEGSNFLVTATTELFDPGLGFDSAWQPVIETIASPLNLGEGLALTGSKFRGVSEGSSGNGAQGSATDGPVVQLCSLNNGQTLFLSPSRWQADGYVSQPVTNFPTGYAQATVFVNGIPSFSKSVLIQRAPSAIVLANPTSFVEGTFQFTFTNTPGAIFSAWATTNFSADSGGWIPIGSPTEIAPGQFQVTDPTAASSPLRFYRVRSP